MSDDTDRTTIAYEDQIVRAIGEELRRARANAGWSRPELIRHMQTQIPVNTYAGYEQGIRQCSIPRLVEICQALGVNASELLALALQRLEFNLDMSGVRIDLRKIVHDEREELSALRQWANNRLKEAALTADSEEPAVVHLQWAVVKEMAIFCGVPRSWLLRYIRDFTPESALRA